MTVNETTGFERCMGVVRLNMNVIGIWPLDKNQNLLVRSLSYVLAFALTFLIIVPQTLKAVIVYKDLNLMIEVLTVADISEGIALLKLFAIMYYNKDLRKLVTQISIDWQNASAKEQVIMWKNAKLCKIVSSFCILTTTSSVIMYTFVFIITSRSKITQENSTITKSLYLKSYFPFHTEKSPVYEIICVSQFLGAFLSCFAFSSFDGFFVCSILHFSGQLFNLKQQLKNLIYEHRSKKISFSKTLETVIKRHLYLVSNTDIIEQDFNKVFLLQIVAVSVVLCLQGYQFVTIISEGGMKSIINIIFIIVYSSSHLLSLFMYCYVAEILHNESQSLFWAIYEMQWYELPAKDLRLLLIVMNRLMMPIRITVGKFANFSLNYFGSVIKTSVSYLTMLLAVKQKT